ncbi:LysR substrate-binding domain-containing protein [Streptomyces sp. NBC_00078]|uniref:LysR family transcriptional regulator n=1 Tax=unclassified Streptomyces TaxID=2593676 RepID=UPI00224DBB47|nr:LysR substrate-binding domain-containing protein [Streptomyces sp. NBC_00078]MCX5424748.1 LysR substrate-binding domain-containing protein [Streptomyces sp. NBC_00078]
MTIRIALPARQRSSVGTSTMAPAADKLKHLLLMLRSVQLIGAGMELRHLRYFVAVAEEGGFSRAARRLHVVQPTLSMQIADLENEFGGRLFDRGSRQTRLTPAGQAFLIEARRVLAQAERAQVAARLALRGETGAVRIGVAGAVVFGGILTARIRAFHEARPLVRIELREAGPETQRAAILAGELDVGFSALPAPLSEPRLTSAPASSVSFLVALPAGHVLAGHETLTAEHISGVDMVEYTIDDGPGDLVSDLSRLARLKLWPASSRFRADSTLGVLALVAAGVGVAVVPAGVHRAAVPNVVYRPLAEPGLTIDFHLLHRTTEAAPAVAAFLNTGEG